MEGLLAELSDQQKKLIRAVITRNPEYVQYFPTLRHMAGGELQAGELYTFVEKAGRDPNGVGYMDDAMLGKISREKEMHGDECHWRGRRARYRIARATLNKRVNELFGTDLPVVEYDLSAESLRKHHTSGNG